MLKTTEAAYITVSANALLGVAAGGGRTDAIVVGLEAGSAIRISPKLSISTAVKYGVFDHVESEDKDVGERSGLVVTVDMSILPASSTSKD